MRRRALACTVLMLVAALSGVPALVANAAPPPMFADSLVTALAKPTDMAFLPDGRMLATNQSGQLRVITRSGELLPTVALDLAAKMCTNSERGLLGVAADPDPATKAFYLFYTARGTSTLCPTNSAGGVMPAGAPRNRVSRFVIGDDNVVNPASETILVDGIYSAGGAHNAGDLHVGKDNLLYISTGDGSCDYQGGVDLPGGSGCGGANDASRDLNILNGKILRVTRTGGIPADNPFVGSGTANCNQGSTTAGLKCQQIFATGLRNPFRMAFDPNSSSTSFRINDVGQDVWEEIDQGAKGADYGWNAREGHCQNTGTEADCGVPKPAQYTDPVYDYSHASECKSITGGAFVPNGVWPSEYTGGYLFSDYVCGKIFLLKNGTRTEFSSGLSSAVAMMFGPSGSTQALYYTTYADGGQIRKITYTGVVNRSPVSSVTATPTSGSAPLVVTLNGSGSSDPDGDALTYVWTFGDGSASVSTSSPTVSHTYAAGSWTASLTVRDGSGATSAAAKVAISSGNRAPVASIQSPATGVMFASGRSYVLTGSATDPEDGALPSSALSWTIIRRHGTHTHPFLGPLTGNNLAFEAPGPEDLAAAADSDLLIQLTATDSKGVATTVSRVFSPHKVPVTLATSPSGRAITVNGGTVTGPTTVTSWEGFPLQVGVPAQVDATGQPYVFRSWSDGGAQNHPYLTPSAAGTLTATLAPAAAPGQPTALALGQTATGAVTVTWQPPTADGGSAVTGYTVSRDGTDSTGAGPYLKTVSATTRTFTFAKLLTGSTYTLSVRAVNVAGTGAAVSGTIKIASWVAPGAPTGLTVKQSAVGAATVTWLPPPTNAGPAISGYVVSRDGTDTTGAGPYSKTVSATTRTFTFAKLLTGSTYTLSVRAVNAAGTGAAASGTVTIS